MYELHVEGREAEYHGAGHIGEVQEGERGDGEEHCRRTSDGARVYGEHVLDDDEQVTACRKEYAEGGQAAATDVRRLQDGTEAGTWTVSGRESRGRDRQGEG